MGISTIVAAAISHLAEPYKSIANLLIAPVSILVYKHQAEIEAWMVRLCRHLNARWEGWRGSLGLHRTIKKLKRRLNDSALDELNRDNIKAELVQLETSLTEQEKRASLGDP